MEEYRSKAVELFNASTEKEVFKTINQDPFFDEENWIPLGRQSNNYGIVENQAGSPMAALTEIVINSTDAIILKYYNQIYSNEDNPPNFSTMEKAVDELIDNPDSETITLAADGIRDPMTLSLVVSDQGQGKSPSEFEKTFLGLLEPGSLKQQYEFLQGQYGMGSSGVLPFCGQQGYKLIISSSVDEKESWSWSIIRKNRDKSQYEYYTIDGKIPTFSGEFENQTYGTFIKMYDYKTDNRTQITSDTNLRRYFERYLLESPIPIELDERRDYKSRVTSIKTNGGLPHLRDNSEIIQKNFVIKHDFENEHLGRRDIEIILLKQKNTLDNSGQRMWENFAGGEKHRRQAVFFTVNGQTHGDQGKSFVRNRCSRPRVADDLLIFVDFSDIAGADLVDLFRPARDRLKENEIAAALLEGLKDAIQEDDVLREEELSRRQDYISNEIDSSPDAYFEETLKRNPALQGLFNSDAEADFFDKSSEVDQTATPVDLDYDPPLFPDRLNIIDTFRSRADFDVWNKLEEPYVVHIPVNETEQIRFELNAPDNYFDREKSPGTLDIIPHVVLKSRRLADGILNLRLKGLPDPYPGDEHSVSVSIDNPSSESLQQTIRIKYVEAREPEEEEKDGLENIARPEVVGVEEDDWEKHGFDEDDVVRIDDYTEEDGGLTIYVNIDSVQIREFISRHSLSQFGEGQAKQRFKVGVAFNSAVQYVHLKSNLEDNSEMSPDEIVEQSMGGTAGALLAQIISSQDINEWEGQRL